MQGLRRWDLIPFSSGDRQSMGDWQFEVIVAPQAPQSPQIANLRWSVCLHVVGSENTPPRFLSGGAPLLISSHILPCSRGHMRGLRSVGPNPPQNPNRAISPLAACRLIVYLPSHHVG